MDLAAQEGAGSEDDGTREPSPAETVDDAGTPAVFHQQLDNLVCLHIKASLLREQLANGLSIEAAVRLGPRPADSRTLAPVEHSKLNAGPVDRAPHDTIERVDLAHQMATAQPTDRRIARHGTDRVEPVCQQKRAGAHAGTRGRRLAAGMSAAHHDDIVSLHGARCRH